MILRTPRSTRTDTLFPDTTLLRSRKDTPEGWFEIDPTAIDRPGKVDKIINPYVNTQDLSACAIEKDKGPQDDPNEARPVELLPHPKLERDRTVIRLPSFEKVRNDPALYAHANRVLHLETNPGNARALVQRHDDRELWLNPPPIPLTPEEMDYVFRSEEHTSELQSLM